ncbi:MAG: ATP-binding protein [Anaerolineae bacterium]|nr:ATP-binding protein [Anaerolineae bacterium]
MNPGLLASANRGIVYVDEVNLLDDHIVDLLLDSAAMGVNVVEREGISFSHPARFILVGTMNPEEGDLRPQLLDRFALSVDVLGIRNAQSRIEILERHIAYEDDPQAFHEEWQAIEKSLSERIVAAREIVSDVQHTVTDLRLIATMMAEMQVDGHRADLVILKTARAHAAYEGRTAITDSDIALAIKLAIPHRLKRGPFADANAQLDNVENQLAEQRAEMSEDGDAAETAEDGEASAQDSSADAKKKVTK